MTYPILIGGDEIRNEIELLKKVENGYYMNGIDSVRFIVIHCSATRCTRDYTEAQLLRDHHKRGFRTVGYHFYIRRNGDVSRHRKLLEVGAHARGFNRCSIGICYEGGLDAKGSPKDTRTAEQKESLRELVTQLHKFFPKALILGHRDLPGVKKACPCFDVTSEYIFNA